MGSCSRNAFLSGRRPDKTKVWNFINNFREVGPNWISLPEYFKQHNYTTLGGGKIYHPGRPPHDDEPKSWSQDKPYFHAKDFLGNCNKFPPPSVNGSMEVFCPVANPISDLQDGKMVSQMLSELEYANSKSKADGNPFFIGIGVHRPHIPWVVPQKFVDMYNIDNTAPATDPYPPIGAPPMAFTAEWDGKQYVSIRDNVPKAGGQTHLLPRPNNTKTFPTVFQQGLRMGYYFAVSYVDYLFGTALQKLDELGLTDDTLVVFTADHGY